MARPLKRADAYEIFSHATAPIRAMPAGGNDAVSRKATRFLTALAVAGAIGTAIGYAPVSQAFKFGDMMNPGKWMGGGKDRYDDDEYGPGPYGPYGGGPYGGGPGAYGPPGYGPYGGGPYGGGPYGGGPYGVGPRYGAPGYSGAPGYRAAPPAPSAPAASSSASRNTKSAEIEALKRRIDELEAKQTEPSYAAPPASDWGSSAPAQDWGSAPAFRPQGKY